MEKVTPYQLQSLRDTFFAHVSNQNPDFCAKDLARIKKDDNWLKRFLVQTDYKVDAAAKMLFETCTWRQENGINELTHHDVLPEILYSGLFCFRNQDKWGKKMLISSYIFFKKGKWKEEDMKKATIYFLERAERESNSDQVTFMHVLENCGMSNCDLNFSRVFGELLSKHYPFFVHYSISYEMPWYLAAIVKLSKAFMPPQVAEKMVIAYKNDIDNYIDEDNRLVEWGGKDDRPLLFEPEIIPSQTLQSNDSENEIEIENQSQIENENQIQNDTYSPDLEKVQDVEDLHSETSTVSIKTVNGSGSGDLIQVPESVVLSKDGAGKISGRFQFRNISSNHTLIFKIKTTAPEKFHVRPTLGLLEKAAVGTVTITIQIQAERPSFPLSSVQKERFQIQVASAPKNLLNGLQDNRKELSEEIGKIWKTILIQETPVENHLINCSLDPTTAKPNGGINNTSNQNHTPKNPNSEILSNEDQVFKRLRQIEQQMDKMKGDFLGKLAFSEKLLYILLGMMIFLFIYLWRAPWNSSETSQNFCKSVS